MVHSAVRQGLTALVLFAGLAAPGAATQQTPQTRTPERGAELLTVAFSVVSDDGTPVADLRPEELKIRIGGRERAVRSLQLISVPGPGTAAPDREVLPAPFGTNAESNTGRTLVVAIDEESIRAGGEGPLRQATTELLAKLGPADRVSLVTLPLGGTKVALTTDHTRMRQAIAQFVGQAPANETGSAMACRSRRTLEALAGYFESLGVRQEPMTMIFVTAALAAPRRDAVSALPPGMCELSPNLFNRVAIAAGTARAGFYAVRPGDASDRGSSVQRETGAGSDNPIAGIEHLAGITEGKLLALTGSSGTAFDRIQRETSAYYLATVDPVGSDQSGRAQTLDIGVTRRGVELRSHPHIAFPPNPAVNRGSRPSLRDMLTTVRAFRDLPMRAAGFPALAADGSNIRVVTLAEAVEPGVTLESAGAALVNQDGKLVAQWTANATELLRTPVIGAMSAPPGAYRLRVAAIDSTGRSGAADYDVTVETVRSGPLRLSSLVLGLSRAGGFSPRLQFGNEPLAVAFVELEGAPAGARLSAGLEVSKTLNGPALVTVPLALESTAENRYTATGSVPLGALPPGDYVVRAMIGLEGHPMTRVVRTIRKAAPAAR